MENLSKRGYETIAQGEFLCAAASLQVILKKQGLPTFPQEVIGRHIGVNKPKTSDDWYGARFWQPGFNLNTFFRELDLPVRAGVIRASDIFSQDHLRQILYRAQTNDIDTLLAYTHGVLYGRDNVSRHVSVFDTIESNDSVWTIDPDPMLPGRKITIVTNLYKAIKHRGREFGGGVWSIYPIS